jgi:hypothetical protein
MLITTIVNWYSLAMPFGDQLSVQQSLLTRLTPSRKMVPSQTICHSYFLTTLSDSLHKPQPNAPFLENSAQKNGL